MKVREAIAPAAARLTQCSDTPRLDAELLMACALGVAREAMLLSDQSFPTPPAFDRLVDRRAAGEPVAYIIGHREFWTIDLLVGPAVLIPRPDTETLIEAALENFASRAPKHILDLGTGSGALLLAALDQWPTAQGLGIDASKEALDVAEANARRLGLAGRAMFRIGDWARDLDARFDLVLCNPPYVEEGADLPRDVADWEPREALFAGPDGLNAYRVLAPQIPRLMAPGGIACVEIGAAQEQSAASLFAAEGLDVACRHDLGGRPRCLVVRQPI
jgi:release factor glutamine methyltransferase